MAKTVYLRDEIFTVLDSCYCVDVWNFSPFFATKHWYFGGKDGKFYRV